MHGNINFVWNKIKVKEKFPHVFHKQLYLHGIFPSIDRKHTEQQGNTEIKYIYGNIMNTSLKEKRTKGLVVQIPPAAPFKSMPPNNIRGRWRRLQRGRLIYGGSDSSIEGETRLQRRGLVYRGQRLFYGQGGLSTEVETCLRRGRLVYGGGGLCTEGKTCLQRGETCLLYRG